MTTGVRDGTIKDTQATGKGTGEVAEVTAFRIEVKGIVQGVGFRPFVHRLVEKYGFTGCCGRLCAG